MKPSSISGNGTGNGNGPTWWQRHGSRAFTRVFSRVLGQPNRYAHAGSLREESLMLTPQQKSTLMSLLIKHELLQPQFTKLDPQILQHYHLCKVVPERHISEFMTDFNEQFKEHFQVARVAGQFSIIPPAPPLAEEPPSARSTIMSLLNKTNRPLSLNQIMEALPEFCRLERIELPPGELIERNISYEIGRLIERGTLQASFAAKKDVRRFFMLHRLYYHQHNRTLFEYTNEQGETKYVVRKEGKNLVQTGQTHKIIGNEGRAFFLAAGRFEQALHRSVFEYEDEAGDKRYIQQGEADRLVSADKAYKFMDADESYAYMAARRFEVYKEFVSEVKTAKRSFWVFNHDLDQLLKKGLVLTGAEEASFETRYIYHEAQRQHPFLIFNAFAAAFLDLEEKGSLLKYQQLRAAFSAGLDFEKPASIPNFLYEAKTLAAMGANLPSIMVALMRRREAVEQLKATRLFKPAQLDKLAADFRALDFLSHFPVLFTPDRSDSLQNFMDFVYDRTENFDVFQLLLAKKISQLRALVAAGKHLPASLQREIELVYAPMAKSKGFEDLSNNMRDLVERLNAPDGYLAVRKELEEAIGMDFNHARRHLASLANHLREDLETHPAYNADGALVVLAVQSRVKEVFSIMEKGDTEEVNIADYLGIRFICKSSEDEEEAYRIAGFLQEKLKTAPKSKIPREAKLIGDHLTRPNKNGWMGWRGYFIDPAQDGRIIAIQILTEEMEKKDKLGKAAHWRYKIGRSIKATAQTLKKKHIEQLFDSSATDEYNGEPEHDYYADQRRARKHVRAFIWPPGHYFSAKAFKIPADGGIPIFRLRPGVTVKSAIEANGFGDLSSESGKYVKLYELHYDQEMGEIRAKPLPRRRARVSPDFMVPNGSLMVIKEEGVPSQRGFRG